MTTKRALSALHLFTAMLVLFLLGTAAVFAQETQEPPTTTTTPATTTTTSEVAGRDPNAAQNARSTDPRALGYVVEAYPGNDEIIGDFVVGPGKAEVALEPGQTGIVELTVTNRTGTGRLFKFTTEDTRGSRLGESSVVLLGDDRGPYSLRDYLEFPEQGLVIEHGERVRVPVRVAIPADAEPGGLYGSVIVETVVPNTVNNQTSASLPQTPLVSRIGILFFVTVGGGIEENGETVGFDVIPAQKTWFSSGPITFGATYENTGSIHTVPYGQLEVYNLQGDQVGFVEIDPWFVMPNSIRTREIAWDRELLVGRYTAVLQMNRGYDDIIDSYEVTFWVFPWQVGLGILGALFVIFFTLRFILTRFELKRKQT